MQILLLLAGLILVIAGGGWFSAATTVGIICLVLFGIITAIQIAVVVAAAKAQKSLTRDFTSRTRRGF